MFDFYCEIKDRTTQVPKRQDKDSKSKSKSKGKPKKAKAEEMRGGNAAFQVDKQLELKHFPKPIRAAFEIILNRIRDIFHARQEAKETAERKANMEAAKQKLLAAAKDKQEQQAKEAEADAASIAGALCVCS